MTPNLSKILYHWGLEKDVRRIGVKSTGIDLQLCMYLLFASISIYLISHRRDGGEAGNTYVGLRDAFGDAR